MKVTSFALVAALAAREAAAHATFQEFWINGVDQGTTCARLPLSNSPVQDVTSNNIRCNANNGPAASKCAVKAGDTVTVEMHQQPNDRSCATEAIGGAHYGPVNVYMSAVSDSSTADGSSGWFHVFQDSWAHNPSGSSGSDDYWGTKDLNANCGKMDLVIPKDIPAGDYLLRAEALALHAASAPGGAQFYMTCFQLTVSGGGSASYSTVKFPGAYSATDPGIEINIYQQMSSYTNPGPAVISSGQIRTAGSSAVGSGSGSGSSGGSSSSSAAPSSTSKASSTTTSKPTTTTAKPSTTLTTSVKPTTSSASGGTCAAKYAQCGGQGWTGATCCASGSTCTANGAYYSQCL